MLERAIVHMDLDSFFVSVERLKDASLIGEPVIIGGHSDRGVVASCSYEARAFGVRSAMPIVKARKLCPQALIVSGAMSDYSQYSKQVTSIVADMAPLYEKASIDEFYIDLSGLDTYFNSYDWATNIRMRIIQETGLPISMAMSTNKTVSKIATGEAKPNGQIRVLPGKEKEFLAPLPIAKIPMVGEVLQDFLKKRGIHTIGQLSEVPQDRLEALLGKHGEIIWRKANGICFSEVHSGHERKSISTETTFEKDINDEERMISVIKAMTEKLCFQIRKLKMVASCVTLKLRYHNFETQTRQIQLQLNNHEYAFINAVCMLFRDLYNPHVKVRLVGVKLSGLVQAGSQSELFTDVARQYSLTNTIDRLRTRYGWKSITKADSYIHYRDL